MLVNQLPVSTFVPDDRTIAIPIRPADPAVMGTWFRANLSAAANLDFYLFNESNYQRLPGGTPYRQWFGTSLGEELTLPGRGAWYLLVANNVRGRDPVQLTGTISYGAI